MKALVTGAGGFLGPALVERLLAHDLRDLRLFVRPGSRRLRLDALVQRYGDRSIDVVSGTLTNAQDCARIVEDVDVVYHLAASMSGAAAELFLNTVVGSKKLLEAIVAVGRKPKVVLISSFGVYGVTAGPRGAVIDETTPLEAHPVRRDLYSYSKLRQEELFRQYQRDHHLPTVILRPGVIYGPEGGAAISSRVGLSVFGRFLHLGGSNLLPLSYVDNCAEAIVVAGTNPDAVGHVYNVVDDDLPTCREFLARYRREVAPLRVVHLPYFATMVLSMAVERYHRWSRGQLPAIFTPYKTRTTWGGNRFRNDGIKSIGWRQPVSTEDGIRRTFDWLARSSPGSRRAGVA